MKNYGKVYSASRPQEVEFTATSVFIASNIEPYTREMDEDMEEGYEYDYVEYTKDEYLIQQTNKINELQQELEAAKILLGVD